LTWHYTIHANITGSASRKLGYYLLTDLLVVIDKQPALPFLTSIFGAYISRAHGGTHLKQPKFVEPQPSPQGEGYLLFLK